MKMKQCSVADKVGRISPIQQAEEEFEDTKDVTRIRKSKKNTMAKRKRTIRQKTIYKTLHRKLKIK
jgi:hypothetical protein